MFSFETFDHLRCSIKAIDCPFIDGRVSHLLFLISKCRLRCYLSFALTALLKSTLTFCELMKSWQILIHFGNSRLTRTQTKTIIRETSLPCHLWVYYSSSVNNSRVEIHQRFEFFKIQILEFCMISDCHKAIRSFQCFL